MSSSIRLFSPLPAKDCTARLQRLLDAASGGSPRPHVEVLSVNPTGARLRIRGRFLSSRVRLKFVPTPNGTRLIAVPRLILRDPGLVRDFLIEALGITGIVSCPELLYPAAPPALPQPSRIPVPEIDDALPAAPIRRDGLPPIRPADDLPPIRGRR